MGATLLALLAIGALPAAGQTPAQRSYMPMVAREPTATPSAIRIQYRAYVQDLGWLPWQDEGNQAGTTDQGRRLEALEFRIVSGSTQSRIRYRSHISGVGWESEWRYDGATSGSAGSTIEAIQVGLENAGSTNNLATEVYAQEWGWLGFVRDFWIAGTVGQARRVEAFHAYMRTTPQELNCNGCAVKMAYMAYIQDNAWNQGWKRTPDYAGTEGQQLRVEAFKVVLYNAPEGMGIEYRANVEGEWRDWRRNGEDAGTTGEAKEINAVEMRLINPHPGTVLSYGAHFENLGWLEYAADNPSRNNPILGNPSDRMRLEALRGGLHHPPGTSS
jgi:uncharacterized protein YjdB